MAGPDDHISDFNVSAYAEQNRNSTLKFPRVPVLDDDGNPTGMTISPADYDDAAHKDHIGCPCCLAKLIAAGSKTEDDGSYKIQGTFDGQRHFKSKRLKDHKEECPFRYPRSGAASRALEILDFLHTYGPKRLNWNFKNTRDPNYAEGHDDVALKRFKETPAEMRQRIASTEAIDPAIYEGSYSVKSVRDIASMIAMIRTMDDPAAVYESIDVISEGKALPLSEMIAGEDWVGLGSLAQMREELGLHMPSVITADTEGAHVVRNFAGYTFVVPPMTRGGDDANGDITGFRLLFMTRDQKAADILASGAKVAVQGYAELDTPMTGKPEFYDLTGIEPASDTVKYMAVYVRNVNHVAAIASNFETEMESEPVYREEYLRSIDPDDPSTWDRDGYDDYDA